MTTLKSTALALLAGTFLTAPAFAADVLSNRQNQDVYQGYADSQMTSWSGFYLGGQAGYGLTINEVTVTEGEESAFIDALGGDGVFGGGRIGADFARGRVLFGVYGSYDFSNVETELGQTDDIVFNRSMLNQRNTLDDFNASVTNDGSWSILGRVGYIAARDTLVYVLGGYTQTQFDLSLTDANSDTFSAGETLDGWTFGGGVEIAKADGWRFGLEGTHTIYDDFGDTDEGFSINADMTETKVMMTLKKQLGFFN